MSLASLQALLGDGRGDFSPFLVLGDPDFDTSVRLAECAARAGVRMLELGIAYDDPCADGPAIQAASARARAAGSTTDRAFEALARIRASCPELALNLLVYGNLVHGRGVDRFCRDAVACGASSLLVPDIPHEEGSELREACGAHALGHVALVGPQTSDERLAKLSLDAEDAFVYLAATQGVTGATEAVDRRELVQRVAAQTRSPLCVGFGITTGEDARTTLAAGARIAVVGSHFARSIAAALTDGASRDEITQRFSEALRPFLNETTREKEHECSSS